MIVYIEIKSCLPVAAPLFLLVTCLALTFLPLLFVSLHMLHPSPRPMIVYSEINNFNLSRVTGSRFSASYSSSSKALTFYILIDLFRCSHHLSSRLLLLVSSFSSSSTVSFCKTLGRNSNHPTTNAVTSPSTSFLTGSLPQAGRLK